MSSYLMTPSGDKSTWEYEALRIVNLGYPAVAEHLPELLVWLQDMNWPGAKIIAEFLFSIGSPLIPHVSEVMNGNDEDWKYWILIELVSRWDRELVIQLEPELMRMACRRYDADDLDLLALKILAKNQLGDSGILKRQANDKQQQIEYRKRVLNEIESYWT